MTATRAAERPLENIANSCALAGQRPDYRGERWAARGVLWDLSTVKRCRDCGRVPVTADGSVQVRANGVTVGYAGLASCGSVWLCPVCNSKIMAVRRLEVGTALAWMLGQGSVAFGTYTVRHHSAAPLRGTWKSLTACWAALGRDKGVREARRDLGLVGTIRPAEVTHGVNGWHPHLHPSLGFRHELTTADVAQLQSVTVAAWVRAADRLGLSTPSAAAQDLHLVTGSRAASDLGDYFTKATYGPSVDSVAWESTSTQTKSRTRAEGSRTPWQLLDAVRLDGDADALDLWHQWESGSKGMRALTWSRGLRAAAGLDVEATDEDIAAAEVGTREDAGIVVTDWSPIVANPRLGAGLLAAVGPAGNWNEGRRFADAHGIDWRNA